MKNFALIIFFFFSLIGFANAQSAKQIAVHIPFDFYAQNQKLPSGDYLIESLSHESAQSISTLIIRDKSGKVKEIITTNLFATGMNKTTSAPALFFNVYGKEYFLAALGNPLEECGFTVKTTRKEKFLAKQFGKPTQETIAFRLTQK